MATKSELLQRMIRNYKDETGETEVDLRNVAAFAVENGWQLSEPADPLDLLAKDLARAAREETRYDEVTGDPYRVNHAVPVPGGNYRLWIDIDEAERQPMVLSLMKRREQMVGDGLQLTRDANHWNQRHANEDPIQIPLDFTDDVEWRLNAPQEEAS